MLLKFHQLIQARHGQYLGGKLVSGIWIQYPSFWIQSECKANEDEQYCVCWCASEAFAVDTKNWAAVLITWVVFASFPKENQTRPTAFCTFEIFFVVDGKSVLAS